eukprot:gene5884-4202_t
MLEERSSLFVVRQADIQLFLSPPFLFFPTKELKPHHILREALLTLLLLPPHNNNNNMPHRRHSASIVDAGKEKCTGGTGSPLITAEHLFSLSLSLTHPYHHLYLYIIIIIIYVYFHTSFVRLYNFSPFRVEVGDNCWSSEASSHSLRIPSFFIATHFFFGSPSLAMAPPKQHHQLPVRAKTGGYLRAPFAISSSFAAAAEKHVDQGSATRGATAASLQWRRRAEEMAEDGEGVEALPTRQWTRAGVGAGALSVKDRKAQQAAAERVYGEEWFGNDEAAATGDTLQVSQQHMFGVDRREQETMKALMTRRLRQQRQQQHGSRDGEEEEEGSSRAHTSAAPHDEESNPMKRVRTEAKGTTATGGIENPPAPAPHDSHAADTADAGGGAVWQQEKQKEEQGLEGEEFPPLKPNKKEISKWGGSLLLLEGENGVSCHTKFPSCGSTDLLTSVGHTAMRLSSEQHVSFASSLTRVYLFFCPPRWWSSAVQERAWGMLQSLRGSLFGSSQASHPTPEPEEAHPPGPSPSPPLPPDALGSVSTSPRAGSSKDTKAYWLRTVLPFHSSRRTAGVTGGSGGLPEGVSRSNSQKPAGGSGDGFLEWLGISTAVAESADEAEEVGADGVEAREGEEEKDEKLFAQTVLEELMREREREFRAVLLPQATQDSPHPEDAEDELRRIHTNVLREMCWHGCPAAARGTVWRMLTGLASSTKVSARVFLPASFGVFPEEHSPKQQIPAAEGASPATHNPSPFAAHASAALKNLQRKRREYNQSVEQLYGTSAHATESPALVSHQASSEAKVLLQLQKDLPRMQFGSCDKAREQRFNFIQHPRVQATLERILYCWSLRHPASGYVQGMNDLLAPFLSVVLAEYVCPASRAVTELLHMDEAALNAALDVSRIPESIWRGEMEADVYFLFSYLLNLVQGHYTQQQAGFVAMVREMDTTVQKADPGLYKHLQSVGIETVQYAFRWMTCLLVRELQPWQMLRLLDAYISCSSAAGTNFSAILLDDGDGDGESGAEDCLQLHVFVCVALLLRFASLLMHMTDFAELLTFLQQLPTEMLSSRDMDELLAEAFLLKSKSYMMHIRNNESLSVHGTGRHGGPFKISPLIQNEMPSGLSGTGENESPLRAEEREKGRPPQGSIGLFFLILRVFDATDRLIKLCKEMRQVSCSQSSEIYETLASTVHWLVRSGADPHAVAEIEFLELRPLLHDLVSTGAVECLAACLDAATVLDFSVTDAAQCTPLHALAQTAAPDAVATEMLRRIVERLQHHPMDLEERAGWIANCVAAGAPMTATPVRHMPCLHQLLIEGEATALRACLHACTRPIDFETRDPAGRRALECLCRCSAKDPVAAELLDMVLERLQSPRGAADYIEWDGGAGGKRTWARAGTEDGCHRQCRRPHQQHCPSKGFLTLAAAHGRLSLFWPKVKHLPEYKDARDLVVGWVGTKDWDKIPEEDRWTHFLLMKEGSCATFTRELHRSMSRCLTL